MECEFVVADLDGVIYRGETPIAGSAEAVEQMRCAGRKVKFMTNNATKTSQEYSAKLSRMGIEVDPDDILTSGKASAIYVRRTMLKDKAYVVGSKSLVSEMKREGLEVVMWSEAEVVVVSLDQEFSYVKLYEAMRAVRLGCPLVATNRDPVVPTEGGFIPGAGSIVAAVEVASGVKAINVGKPSKHMLRIAEDIWNLKRGSTCVVGDRLDTDVEGGNSFGWRTILVLSGSTGPSDLVGNLPDIRKPSAIYQNIKEFVTQEILAH